jgi:phospholipid/cholesterol/gamma-HCH transport system permease protein
VQNPATILGRRATTWILSLVEFLGLLYATLATIPKLRFTGMRVVSRVFLNQIRFTGVHALGPVTLASLAIGGLVLLQAATYLPADYVVRVAMVIVVKEIVPLLTALILIGRSGTAIAIEIAHMKLGEELAAIVEMGIAVEHLVYLPRLLGMVVSFLGLAVYANVAAVLGGYYLARSTGVVPITFNLVELLDGIEVADAANAALKVSVFAVIIALTSIQYGLRASRSVREVPIVTTGAVVRSMIACLILNSFISVYV